MIDIETEADLFATSLSQFIKVHELDHLLTKPIDHIAVKLKGPDAYEDFLSEITLSANSIEYIKINDRRIATAILNYKIQVGTLGQTSYLEIMEPRPEKVGKDKVGVDHIEIVNEDIDTVEQELKQKKIEYSRTNNGHHEAIILIIDKLGHEIKITNKSIEQVLQEESQQGLLVKIK